MKKDPGLGIDFFAKTDNILIPDIENKIPDQVQSPNG